MSGSAAACSRLTSVLLALALPALWSCAPGPSGEPREYEVEGQVLAVRPDTREVLVKHGDIKNFMPAMTMPFKVRERELLDGVQPGDLVRATLVVGRNEAWLSALERTGAAALEEEGSIPAASFVTPLQPGDEAPVATLTGDRGEPLPLAEWRGRAYAVTFIYVRCPLPQFCPMLDRRFAEIQREIRADETLAGRARLLSVSFDPDADTPERLAAHAARLGADPAMWRFATSPRDEVDRFAAHFGVNVIREADGTITHNMRTAVVGADGRVVSIYEGGDWSPGQVVEDLRRAAAR